MSKKITFAFLLAFAVLMGGCVYRPDVQQGNIITSEQMSQLELGMSKREVKYLFGTPLVGDPFHANRWDYYFSFTEGRNDYSDRQSVSLFFEDDTLALIEGSAESHDIHAQRMKIGEMSKAKKKRRKSKPGFFSRLKDRFRKDDVSPST